ncbi:MAG: dihydropyrimidine dehydrogenase subunit A [Deltaproteobacteria bacterium]|nr:MAG: dihydropyrimidine dehydrogenase subunit A [Deltaproteobacteria bacterium]
MEKVLFSSWAGKIIDNRGKSPDSFEEAEPAKLPETYKENEKIIGFMGWDGIILRDESVSIVDMARAYLKAVQEASCGRCIPCRVGTRVMLEILERICAGKGETEDLETLKRLGVEIQESAKCEIGKSGPIPILHAITYFNSEFEKQIAEKNPIPQGSYHSHITAPCINACPVHLDIPNYVELIKNLQYEESLRTIRERNALPGVCGRVCIRPCEFNCRRANLDDPIQIKFLKRFVADYEIEHNNEPQFEVGKRREEKVAIVGAGPAGLSAAFYLSLKGYPVKIFEALPEGGGMAAVGIPDYRLPRNILKYEIEVIKKTGVEIQYNTRVGKDITLEEIKAQGYRAIFIAVGAHLSKKMRVEGEDAGYEGFIKGVDFLRDINLGKEIYKGKKLLVVGGGNVAIDCVRSAFRVGFTDVNIVYRRSRAEMPADDVEIEDAEKEGVKFHFLTLPKRIITENNRVTAVECIRMELGEPDESGRRRPVPVEGSEFIIETDVLIPAIGQDVDLSLLPDESGVEKTKWNTIVVDSDSMMSSQEGIFSGGDCVTGPDVLVRALAAGYDAAIAIDQYLRGEEFELPDYRRKEKIVEKIGVYDKDEKIGIVGGVPKSTMEHLPPDTRVNSFDEVELGFTFEAAIREANRCLRCYRIALFTTRQG